MFGILLARSPINNYSFVAVIATALTEPEIRQDWQWLFDNVCPTLHSFDTEEEVTEFVCCKINSILATEQEIFTEGMPFIFYILHLIKFSS